MITEPENAALRESLVRFEIARARYLDYRDKNIEPTGSEQRWIEAKEGLKMETDRLVACWRDIIHAYLKTIGTHDPHLLHQVMDSMDLFIDRSKA